MQMWRDIEAQFNASAEVERTYDQLRELWKRLKIAMKKELEVRQPVYLIGDWVRELVHLMLL